MANLNSIGILGGGAWGTALAVNTLKAGRETRLWAREQDVADTLTAGKGNPIFLPGIELPAIAASTDMNILRDCDAILAVVPAQFARQAFAQLRRNLSAGIPVILCAKGIEQSTLSLMTDVMNEVLPEAIPAVLSGPSFAADVARDLPTAVTLACEDEALGADIMRAIGRPSFRPYWTNDLIGAEVSGAIKNVLAIACGIVEGMELGKSAHAAVIARGFAEMTRLGVALGARAETFGGLCGLGDLVLTCSSPQSRNMSFGMALGQGRKPEAILAERKTVTEGVATAPAMVSIAARESVEMPICTAVHNILCGNATVEDAITDLLSRPFSREAP